MNVAFGMIWNYSCFLTVAVRCHVHPDYHNDDAYIHIANVLTRWILSISFMALLVKQFHVVYMPTLSTWMDGRDDVHVTFGDHPKLCSLLEYSLVNVVLFGFLQSHTVYVLYMKYRKPQDYGYGKGYLLKLRYYLKSEIWEMKIQSNPVISRAVNSRKSVSRACTLDPKF